MDLGSGVEAVEKDATAEDKLPAILETVAEQAAPTVFSGTPSAHHSKAQDRPILHCSQSLGAVGPAGAALLLVRTPNLLQTSRPLLGKHGALQQ